MKELIVKKSSATDSMSLTEIFKQPEFASWNNIDTVNWSEYGYRPQAQFRMAYTDKEFLLHYRVKEKYLRAAAAGDNDAVWKDSCVEFFMTPADDGFYYNFEFNCVGTCLSAAGKSRHNREPLPIEIIAQIRRESTLGRNPFRDERKGDKEWELMLAIPYTCLFKHPGWSPAGKSIRANFYKCGDELSEPHYLSWNPIETEKPDFHRPEFFGTVRFES